MFNYAHVTAATQVEYEAVLQRQADAFSDWTANNRAHKDESLARSYELWWMFKGPVNFLNPEQTARFRTELFAWVVSHPPTAPAPTDG